MCGRAAGLMYGQVTAWPVSKRVFLARCVGRSVCSPLFYRRPRAAFNGFHGSACPVARRRRRRLSRLARPRAVALRSPSRDPDPPHPRRRLRRRRGSARKEGGGRRTAGDLGPQDDVWRRWTKGEEHPRTHPVEGCREV